MDSSARKMLRFIKQDPVCKDGFCLFCVFYNAYCEKTNCSEQEAMACIRYLADLDYVRFGQDQNGRDVGFELEHKAYHVFRFSFAEKWQIYVIPAVVTVLTNVMLYAAKWLWPRIQQWLSALF